MDKRVLLIGCGAVSVLGVLLVGMLVVATLVVGGSEQDATGGGTQAPGSEGEEAGGLFGGKTFTRENYGEVVSDPNAHQGAKVDIVGQIFQPPEGQGGEAFFQIWADPKNAEWSTVVWAGDDLTKDLNSDDYVRVRGTVTGKEEGQNAFGADLTTLGVEADSVELVDDPAAALDPARETVEVKQTQSDNGFSVTLKRVEFGEENTRAYVKANNGTSDAASMFTYEARIVQGSTQIDAEMDYQFDAQEPQSDIEPGVETDGVITFGPADPNSPFKLRIKWFSEDYNINSKPLVFEVTP